MPRSRHKICHNDSVTATDKFCPSNACQESLETTLSRYAHITHTLHSPHSYPALPSSPSLVPWLFPISDIYILHSTSTSIHSYSKRLGLKGVRSSRGLDWVMRSAMRRAVAGARDTPIMPWPVAIRRFVR